MVALFRTMAVVALLAAWSVVPVLACVLPAQPMNAEEMRCCKKMTGNCDAMKAMPGMEGMTGMQDMQVDSMQAVHSCCKSRLNAASSALRTPSTRIASGANSVVGVVTGQVASQPCFSTQGNIAVLGHSPPLLLNAILRI